MKLRRHNLSNDAPTSSTCISRSSTSFNGRGNSEPIPYDLIYELLLRLPAKSIARSRCVSKLWASILRRHDFTELFLTRSSTRQQLLFACKKDDALFFFKAPQNPDNNSSLVVPDYHMKFCFDDTFQICGHVRGLVCLKHLRIVNGRKHTVPAICNPSTGQSILLPKVKTTSNVKVRCFFVYDPIGKQFKVLSMTWSCYGSHWFYKEHQVLTLGTCKLSWRMIECSVPHRPTSGGICINGCLYYHTMVNSVEHYLIVCFDATSEKFTSIRKPTGVDVRWIELNLVNYNGKLATLTSDGRGEVSGQSRCIELWVLVDAEKHEWSKHVYELPTLWKGVVAKYFLYFIGITGTSEIVMLAHNSPGIFNVFYYNFEGGTIRKVEFQGMDAFRHCSTFLHHVEDVKLFGNV